jgi:ATP-dependent Clp protease adaptor protein ClpS
MMDVHTKGRATVSHGARERMEYDAARLHTYGLWATVDKQ